jgi:hypothetical protein
MDEDFAIHPFPALNAPFRNTTDSPWQVTDDILAFISLIRTFVSDFSSNTLTLRVRSRLSWDTCVQDWLHVYETVRYIPPGFLLQLLAGQSRSARFGIIGQMSVSMIRHPADGASFRRDGRFSAVPLCVSDSLSIALSDI